MTLHVPLVTRALSNSLTVVVSENRSAPVFGLCVLYRIGSRLEPRGRSGFAHLFEHLMFQGTPNAPKGTYDRVIEGGGGINNGSTRYDYTNYIVSAPVSALDAVLWLEADRMKMLDFTWKAASDTTSLELEIHQYSFASDKLVYKAEITGMKHSINPFEVLSPGNFYWQISALKKAGGTVIARSAPSRGYFSIPAGPEIKAPKIGNMKIYVE